MSVATLARKVQGHDDLLAPNEDPFSTNKVTGYSLNFPIIGTCTPSVVCSYTCYFAKGPSTWNASLAKQHRLLNSLRADPGVVSRKPEVAATITPRPNVYLHLSVDRSSWDRLERFRKIAPAGLQWFHSYQCDRGEVPIAAIAPVVFRDKYDLDGSAPIEQDCPLNLSESIVRVCESCRRCFNGDAVRSAKECHAKPPSSPRLFG